jgi:hypothetical protein
LWCQSPFDIENRISKRKLPVQASEVEIVVEQAEALM